MGKDPDAIYREITEHRDRMSRKRQALAERLRSDLGGVKERVQDRSPVAVSDLNDRVAARPISYLAAGFGAGVLAGILTPGLSLRQPNGHSANGHSSDGASPNSHQSYPATAGLTAVLSGTFVSAIDDAIRPMVRDGMAGFKSDERRPEQRDGDV